MSVEKINESALAAEGFFHTTQKDVPGKTAQEMKEFFDRLPREVLIPKINAIIEQAEADKKETAENLRKKADGDSVYTKTEADKLLKKKIDANKATLEFANALKGTARGASVSVNDASPVEHTLNVRVESKNRIDIKSAFFESQFGSLLTNITTDNNTLRFEKKYTGSISAACSVYAYLEPGTYVFSGIGETDGDGNMAYTIINPDGTQLGGTYTIGKTYQEFMHYVTVSQSGRYTIRMYIGYEAANGSYVSYKNLQIEKGTKQTDYAPFVDVEGIIVSKLVDGVKVQSATASADGTVEDIVSTPAFELSSDADEGSLLINLEYNRDINKVSFRGGTSNGSCILIDKTTEKMYDLYVSNGKLMLAESEV